MRNRQQKNLGGRPEDGVRDAVSALESMVGQFAKHLAELATLSNKRRNRLTSQRFHNLRDVINIFNTWFDIDVARRGASPNTIFPV